MRSWQGWGGAGQDQTLPVTGAAAATHTDMLEISLLCVSVPTSECVCVFSAYSPCENSQLSKTNKESENDGREKSCKMTRKQQEQLHREMWNDHLRAKREVN